jgi:hypothetical protein
MTSGANSVDALNVIASRNSGGTDQWWSWGVTHAGVFKIVPNVFAGTNYTTLGLTSATTGGISISATNTTTVTLTVKGTILSNGSPAAQTNGGIGYGEGAGVTITQSVGARTVGITANGYCGTIIFNSNILNANTSTNCTFSNSALGVGDIVVFTHYTGGTLGQYILMAAAISAGSCTLTLRNISTSNSATESPSFKFLVIKAVTS